MDENVGRPETYTECFQWFIAPTDLAGNNADPTKRPHVMNNSWGCPASELCAPDSLQQIVENTQAAGIFVVVSAGNAGSGCSTVQDPPAIYEASYSVGAMNTGAMSIASFSSRGPVTVDGPGRIKPDIAAPGNPNRSSVPTTDSTYAPSEFLAADAGLGYYIEYSRDQADTVGIFTGIAAFFGSFMNINYLLAGTVSTNPILFAIATWLVLAWKVAGWWGLDRWILPALGTPWRTGYIFRGGEEMEKQSMAEGPDRA